MFRLFLIPLLAALLSGPPAVAEEVAAPTAGPAWYDSAEAAVVAAANRYNPASIAADTEYIGAVLRGPGGYTYTVARGEPGADRVSARIRIPAGAELVAFWHTHGARANVRRYFSRVDAALVAEYGLPFYLADHTGRLKVLRPGHRRLSASAATRLGLPARAGYAKGELVRASDGAPLTVRTVAGMRLAGDARRR